MIWLTLLLNFAFTLAVYVLPIWIYRHVIKKRPINPKQAKRIAIIWGIAILVFDTTLSFVIALQNDNYTPRASIWAALLWGTVNYRILKSGYGEPTASGDDQFESIEEDVYVSETSKDEHPKAIEENADVPQIQEPQTISASKILFCRKCGTKLQDGSLFCNKCGTKIIV